MINLLREIAQQSLLAEDIGQGGGAGAQPVRDLHVAKPNVNFALMKNLLDKDNVATSDVATYLDAAHSKNDEVDTVTFGLETDEGEVVKVYVNVNDAEAFESAMALLGSELRSERKVACLFSCLAFM